ncbi:MAG: hypothetical protein PF568_01465 [Deltaproteobacteria bacterium]|nr:hypothetical protein [Deltaproteobacteria bacterium]
MKNQKSRTVVISLAKQKAIFNDREASLPVGGKSLFMTAWRGCLGRCGQSEISGMEKDEAVMAVESGEESRPGYRRLCHGRSLQKVIVVGGLYSLSLVALENYTELYGTAK